MPPGCRPMSRIWSQRHCNRRGASPASRSTSRSHTAAAWAAAPATPPPCCGGQASAPPPAIWRRRRGWGPTSRSVWSVVAPGCAGSARSSSRSPHVDRSVTLVIPPLQVSTPAAYRAWDQLGGPSAPGPNDLEPAAIAVEPDLARWRDLIGDACGRTPVLAGSGATWFVYGEHDNALAALGNEGAEIIAARTIRASSDPRSVEGDGSSAAGRDDGNYLRR